MHCSITQALNEWHYKSSTERTKEKNFRKDEILGFEQIVPRMTVTNLSGSI